MAVHEDPPWELELYKQVAQLRELTTEQHGRIRRDMNEGFERLSARFDLKFDDVKMRVNDVDKRVALVEQTIENEEKLSVKRGAWAGLIAAFGLQAGWSILENIWKKP